MKSKPLKIFKKFQSRQLILAFVYIFFLLVKVVHVTWRPWEGHKSGRKSVAVDENLSEHGICLKQFSTVHTANARLNDAAIYFLLQHLKLLNLSEVFSPLQIIILGVLVGSTFLRGRMKTCPCPPVKRIQCADLQWGLGLANWNCLKFRSVNDWTL